MARYNTLAQFYDERKQRKEENKHHDSRKPGANSSRLGITPTSASSQLDVNPTSGTDGKKQCNNKR